MSIFGGLNAMTSNDAPLNLDKGEILDLNKYPTLKHIIVGCGWKINVAGADNFDLDISAFLLNKDGRVANPREHVVFFNSMSQKGIYLEGDNLTGGDGDSDDERIHVDLDAIDPSVDSIIFNVNIFKAQEKRQTFGMIKKAYIRLLDTDKNEQEVCRFPLKEDASSATAVTFARLFRVGNGWSFQALGQTMVVPDLNKLLIRYM